MSADLLELLFSQSLDGFFFMMLDEPVQWDDQADKERLLDYVFAHHRVTKVNGAMLAQYGATEAQFVGRTPADFYKHDIPHGRRAWREFFDRGRLHIKTHERRLDGTPIDIEGDYICLYDDAGRIMGHFGIQRDITEETRLRAASDSRIRAIINAVPDLVFVMDSQARYLEIVTQDERRLYRPARELLGRRVDEVLPDEAALPLGDVVRATAADGAAHVSEYPLETAEGLRWFEARTAPVRTDDDGGTPNVVAIVRDITDSKRAEELERQNVYLREAFDADLHFGEILGRSPAMQAVFRAVELVASTDSSVLLLGETGTGKELIARAIHRSSRRSAAVMVKVNCAALPATLIESELFGHERGAFTGAVQQRKGRFELANRGTLFLDEVGELPLEAQVKLLRVLQEHEFERVGGTHTVRVDTRVIAATNRELEQEVDRGTFRADLFFRLNIFPMRVPALRDRRDDIPILAHHFLREFASRLARQVDRFDAEALERLVTYRWPGNVRELANVLERAVILCEGRVLQGRHLSLPAAPTRPRELDIVSLAEAERRHILKALEKTGGVLAGPKGAAALLGLNRSTLWSRMRKLGIQTH
jgi:PAS domain S-box-containing protein